MVSIVRMPAIQLFKMQHLNKPRSGRQLPEVHSQYKIPISQDTVDGDALLPRPGRSADREPKMISTCEMEFDGRFKERSRPCTHFNAHSSMRLRSCTASKMLHSKFLCRGNLAGHEAFSPHSVGSSLQGRQERDIVS